MKRVAIVLLLIISSCCHISAQIDTLNWFEGVKLRPDDFKGISSGGEYFDISIGHTYYFEPRGWKGNQPLIRSWAYFNRTTSVWNGSPQSLRYAQLLFDLGGYHGRLIKSRVLKLGLLPPDITTARSMLEANMFETDQELAVLRSKLEQELQSDDPAGVLEKWEKKIHDWLKEVPAVEIRESGSGWRLGMFLGGEEKG